MAKFGYYCIYYYLNFYEPLFQKNIFLLNTFIADKCLQYKEFDKNNWNNFCSAECQ